MVIIMNVNFATQVVSHVQLNSNLIYKFSDDDCLSCTGILALDTHVSYKKCVSQCRTGYYKLANICDRCYSFCDTCTGDRYD